MKKKTSNERRYRNLMMLPKIVFIVLLLALLFFVFEFAFHPLNTCNETTEFIELEEYEIEPYKNYRRMVTEFICEKSVNVSDWRRDGRESFWIIGPGRCAIKYCGPGKPETIVIDKTKYPPCQETDEWIKLSNYMGVGNFCCVFRNNGVEWEDVILANNMFRCTGDLYLNITDSKFIAIQGNIINHNITVFNSSYVYVRGIQTTKPLMIKDAFEEIIIDDPDDAPVYINETIHIGPGDTFDGSKTYIWGNPPGVGDE